MPYIVSIETTLSDGAINNVDISMPAGHQVGDMTVLMITQDGGGTNILNAGGEFTIIGTQGAAQAQRTIGYYRIHTAVDEDDVNFTGTNDEWIVTAVLIRGASALSVHQEDRTNSVNSTSNFLTSGTVTTTVANCLVLSAFGFDGVFKLALDNTSLNKSVNISKEINIGCVQICQYFNQLTAGATDTLTALSEVQSEGGSALIIAIAEATPATALMSPMITQAYEVLKRYGGITTAANNVAAFIRHDGVTWDVLTDITPTSIGGLAVGTVATETEITFQGTLSTWGSMTGLNRAGSVSNVDTWVGGTHAVSATDFRNKIFSIEFVMSHIATSYFGAEGVLVYFEDSSGEWAAFQMSRRQRMVQAIAYVYFLDMDNAVPYDESGDIDWSDVTRVAYAYHRRGTATTAAVLRVKNALLLDKVVMVDGCEASPCNPALLERVLGGLDPIASGGHGAYMLATLQGKGQSLARFGVQYGDGTRKTYYDASATSLELPLRADSSLGRRFWQVPNYSSGGNVIIRASANDVVKQNACVVATDTEQDYSIHSSSSPSASYDFAGSSIIGWRVTHNVAGITVNGATLQGCRITLNGGTLNGCIITNSKTHLTTNNPEEIKNCDFISGGGHAIRITATGTYDFEGNTFTGYGADGTANAMIFNDSGGLVTLVLPAGAQQPTILNGSGASTVLESPTVDIVVPAALEDSRIQVYNVTQTTEIDNAVVGAAGYEFTVTSEADNGDTIRLRLTLLGKEPIEQIGVFSSVAGLNFLVNQIDDDTYTAIGIDGSTVTEFAPNYTDDYVEVDAATTTKARFAAWWFHNLTTADGIRNWYGGLFLEDEANYRVIVSRVDIQFDNVNTAPTRFTDNERRLYRSDLGNIIASTSGSIQLDSGKVYTSIVTVGGSSVITGDIAEVQGKVQDGLTAQGYTTARATALDDLAHIPNDTAVAVWGYPEASLFPSDSVGRKLVDEMPAIKAKTDNLPTDPASNTQVNTRLAASSYVAPANSDITAIKAKTDTIPSGIASETNATTNKNELIAKIDTISTGGVDLDELKSKIAGIIIALT